MKKKRETDTNRPKLLVSVRNAAEVEAALAGGADWIDLKEPKAGALAGVDVTVAREAVAALAGRRPLSAALGELWDWRTSPTSGLLGVPGIGVVKLGLAGCAKLRDWQQAWLNVAKEAAEAKKSLAAVVYADWRQAEAPAPEEILRVAQAAECRFLLVDTFEKSQGSILSYLTATELEQIFETARHASITTAITTAMTTVLAGSLSLEILSQLPLAYVDMVAVRGAVCEGDRTGVVRAKRVRNFCDRLDRLPAICQEPHAKKGDFA